VRVERVTAADDDERMSADRAARRRRGRRRTFLVLVLLGSAAIASVVLAERLRHDGPQQGRYVVGAWSFGDQEALDRATSAGTLHEVSCDWLQSRADGSLAAPRYDQGFVDAVRDAGLRPWVTLTDYDQDSQTFERRISAAVLATAERRRRHAAAVASWADEHGFDGVDVDWEAVSARRRDAFSAFIEALAAALDDRGLLLAVDVYPKTSEPGGWDGPQGQEWRRLGDAVDQFRIMTYNYSGSWSGPGPLSPPRWMDQVLRFAESQVDPAKVVMGIGFYGREWRGEQTRALTWDDLQDLLEQRPRRRRTASGELRLDYRQGGDRLVAFFPDGPALRAKVAVLLRRHPRIAGVHCWLLGQEDPRAWRVFEALLR
jgi:spore germination protein YaaH